MKKILTLLIYFCFTTTSFSQYHFFSSEENITDQNIIETSDNGLLIVSIESCYIIGGWAIEGCVYGLHLVKTNLEGDTLWTNVIDYYTQVGPSPQVFENNDGSFTILAGTNQSYICGFVGTALSGWNQLQIINVNSNGELLNEVRIPNECELTVRDWVRVDDDKYAVVAYNDMNFNNKTGNLLLIDKSGSIINGVIFLQNTLKTGQIIKNNNELLLLYEKDDELNLNTYDLQLNLINQFTNSNIDNTCLTKFYPRANAEVLSSGEICVSCIEGVNINEKLHFFKFDQSLNLIVDNKISMIQSTNFIENDDGELLVVSQDTTNSIYKIKVNYISEDLDSLNSILIPSTEKVVPTHFIHTSNNQLSIIGNANCCNSPDASLGPSKAFLLFENQVSSDSLVIDNTSELIIFPNPTSSFITIKFNQLQLLESDDYEIKIYTSIGHLLVDEKITSESTQISLNEIQNGIFFYTITNFDSIVTSGRIIKNGNN